MSIEKLLETKQGAIAVKAKLKAMPDRDKENKTSKSLAILLTNNRAP
jgi:hypothetical protein